MESVDELVEAARVRDMCRSGAARSIRTGAQVTLAEMAELCGVTPVAVLRWERAERTPRGEHALRYLAALEGLMSR
jgi:transcriptional regulator with XRE-family HTH domain